MELVFEINDKFDKDLKRLDPKDRCRVIHKINASCSLLKNQPAGFFKSVYRPLIPHLVGGLKSTLYTLRIDRDIRVILTVDEDPIFDQNIVTLIRAVCHNDLDKAFRGIAEALYHQDLIALKPDKHDGTN